MLAQNNKKVNIAELYAVRNKKKTLQKKTFEEIVIKIHNRMRAVASQNALNCFYEIPPFILGYPLYDINDATGYVVNSLRASGFLVQVIPTHSMLLYISWNPAELNPVKRLR